MYIYIAYCIWFLSQRIIPLFYYYYRYYLISTCRFIIITFSYLYVWTYPWTASPVFDGVNSKVVLLLFIDMEKYISNKTQKPSVLRKKAMRIIHNLDYHGYISVFSHRSNTLKL